MELFDQMAAPEKQEEALTPQQELVWVWVARFRDLNDFMYVTRKTRFVAKKRQILIARVMLNEFIHAGKLERKDVVENP